MIATMNDSVLNEFRELYSDQELDMRMVKKVNNTIEENVVILGDEDTFSHFATDGKRVGYAVGNMAMSQGVFLSAEERDAVMPLVEKYGRVFSAKDFENNPYLKNISFEKEDLGKIRLVHGSYEPYQLINYDVPSYAEGRYFTVPKIAYFTEPFLFPCFLEAEDVWMSITPNEIFTMAKPIEKAAGNVLTLGCGMGYFAYMAAIKPEVDHVTIIEFEPDVIKLFERVLLPQFPEPEKITIIQADAYKFMAEVEDGEYDYCFADTWIGADSLDQYLRMWQTCKRLEKTDVDYWIEESFLNSLLRNAFHQSVDAMDVARGKEPRPRTSDPAFRRAFDYIGRLLEYYKIESADDIRNFMSPAKLRALMDASDIEY